MHENRKKVYRIVASTNTCYYSENQLFIQRSQYIRTENPLHIQSEKAYMCFHVRRVRILAILRYLLWKHEQCCIWRLCDESILWGTLWNIILSFPNSSYGQNWFVCLVQPAHFKFIGFKPRASVVCTKKYFFRKDFIPLCAIKILHPRIFCSAFFSF